MNRLFWIALGSIALSVAAQFALKRGMTHVRPLMGPAADAGWSAWMASPGLAWLAGGFALYGLGALVWLVVLGQWDVSKAYPLVGLGFVATAVVGHLMGEAVVPMRVAGIALICLGVFLVART